MLTYCWQFSANLTSCLWTSAGFLFQVWGHRKSYIKHFHLTQWQHTQQIIPSFPDKWAKSISTFLNFYVCFEWQRHLPSGDLAPSAGSLSWTGFNLSQSLDRPNSADILKNRKQNVAFRGSANSFFGCCHTACLYFQYNSCFIMLCCLKMSAK